MNEYEEKLVSRIVQKGNEMALSAFIGGLFVGATLTTLFWLFVVR